MGDHGCSLTQQETRSSFYFQENYDDPHKTPASPVVHIRGLIDGVVEADLVEALQEFGPIRYQAQSRAWGSQAVDSSCSCHESGWNGGIGHPGPGPSNLGSGSGRSSLFGPEVPGQQGLL